MSLKYELKNFAKDIERFKTRYKYPFIGGYAWYATPSIYREDSRFQKIMSLYKILTVSNFHQYTSTARIEMKRNQKEEFDFIIRRKIIRKIGLS